MTEMAELREQLRTCPNLPSSPAVAKRLIQLMESPSPDIEEVVQVLRDLRDQDVDVVRAHGKNFAVGQLFVFSV